jgi:ribosomal protein L30E
VTGNGGDAGGPQAPTDGEALLRMLGLALRAGKLAVGAEQVSRLVARGRRPVLVLATDASPRQRDRYLALAPVRAVWGDLVGREDLARALGRRNLTVVALDDPDFLRGIGAAAPRGGRTRRRRNR